MALVSRMDAKALNSVTRHTEAPATYSILKDEHGNKILQIDTYGSAERENPGKLSQSIRFSRRALQQLREILESEIDA